MPSQETSLIPARYKCCQCNSSFEEEFGSLKNPCCIFCGSEWVEWVNYLEYIEQKAWQEEKGK